MKRLIDYYLSNWKSDPQRKPLLMKGARQIGKTYSVKNLGKSFDDYVEINFEFEKRAHSVFEKNLDPHRIIRELSLIADKSIVPGKTLLFLDEIQTQPQALLALRYFYELIPELHVIAAGSLLDFAIEQVGVPVGRVQALYMYPLSFIEFLAAMNKHLLIKEILLNQSSNPITEIAHNQLLSLLGEYLVFGGMPESVLNWKQTKNPLKSSDTQSTILDFYRQDFGKYARRSQIKYVDLLFDHVPVQLGNKFKYSAVEGEYRKRELAPALDLFVTAGIVHKVFHSSGQGIPLGAQIDPHDFKVIFLDSGLAQTALGLDISQWFLSPLNEFVNKGSLVKAFVGQEILAYSNPRRR